MGVLTHWTVDAIALQSPHNSCLALPCAFFCSFSSLLDVSTEHPLDISEEMLSSTLSGVKKSQVSTSSSWDLLSPCHHLYQGLPSMPLLGWMLLCRRFLELATHWSISLLWWQTTFCVTSVSCVHKSCPDPQGANTSSCHHHFQVKVWVLMLSWWTWHG